MKTNNPSPEQVQAYYYTKYNKKRRQRQMWVKSEMDRLGKRFLLSIYQFHVPIVLIDSYGAYLISTML